eukprot:CAMPEP_0206161592 /NCGR_PEP_ID=MMETSP1474-20131121/7796_1 /ASSEMBLY_ACC=CAM_ASM_001110 /TAXON_ID=97495 /ORGANISM="Imantonia sp., Strain RCC918" /LENGTH=38 /DNA_ID= /DNA_START= /DNA_END= /DNA_ORIENTATION=
MGMDGCALMSTTWNGAGGVASFLRHGGASAAPRLSTPK